MDPVEVETRLIREGGRIRVAEAEFLSGGVRMAKASCQFLRVTEPPAGEVWGPPNWDAPPPEEMAAADPSANGRRPAWATRAIAGDPAEGAKVRRTWVSEIRDLVGGVALTPFQRVAVSCDFVSPTAHSGSEGLSYINSDVTVYLHRAPVGQWIGYEKRDHQATAGVAVGQVRLYDVQGPLGLVACAALGQRSRLGGLAQVRKA
jgi:hypothetical protein